jgi:hypothetical protein
VFRNGRTFGTEVGRARWRRLPELASKWGAEKMPVQELARLFVTMGIVAEAPPGTGNVEQSWTDDGAQFGAAARAGY